MRKRRNGKAPSLTPMSKDDMLDMIVPKRAVEVTAARLAVIKKKVDPRTKAVNSKSYGFPLSLTMFVLPGATENEIIEKFNEKFKINVVVESNFRKKKAV